jgi:hypothetical protein
MKRLLIPGNIVGASLRIVEHPWRTGKWSVGEMEHWGKTKPSSPQRSIAHSDPEHYWMLLNLLDLTPRFQ